MSRKILNYPHQVLPYLLFGGGALIVLFWTLYYSSVLVSAGDKNTPMAAYETAFPVADCVVSLVLIAAGVCMLQKRPFGTFSLAAASSMVLYLGILDATFNSVHGYYLPLTSSSITKVLINAVCISGGALGLLTGWKTWRGR